MSSKARVEAFLGMDISRFASGLDKANGLLAGFKRGFKIGGMGSLGGLIGAGAIIHGFRGIMNAAQDARDEAKELGTTIDAGTASVAAYADRWDLIRDSIKGAGIAMLSLFTMTGRSLGQAMGMGSSDAEVRALDQNKEDQKQREKDLKANQERIGREITAAEKELGELRRSNKLNGLPAKERALALDKELFALFEKRSKLQPRSLEAKKTEIEIEKRLSDIRENNARLERENPVNPSEMKSSGAFGLSVAEVASGRPVGRRSERERRAGEVMALESRGKAAESAGQFNLAKSYRDRAKTAARSMGFGEVETSVGSLRHGGRGGSSSGMAGVGPSWDEKYGGQLAARNASLNATYGGAFKRPDSFEQSDIESDADLQLQLAAVALQEAAEALKEAMQSVDVDAPDGADN